MLNRLGACGETNDSKNMIVALGIGLFNSKPDGGNSNNNPFCGNRVQVQHGLRLPVGSTDCVQGTRALKSLLSTHAKSVETQISI